MHCISVTGIPRGFKIFQDGPFEIVLKPVDVLKISKTFLLYHLWLGPDHLSLKSHPIVDCFR